ncbi:MAG: metallophosphoesterase family protein [Armatimonadota bacterium]|nr:metallophosphoesterase family protein [bacterium]MDW8319816.1 metallophosphoesterase family protein [Armatimonadota bacterium]
MNTKWMLIAAVVWAWTNLVEPFHLRLRRRSLILPSIPACLDGLTILHLSDLHVRKMGFLERKLVRLLANTSADLAVLTGDLVDSASGIQPLCEVVSHLQTSLGVYAVWGNAEHKSPEPSYRDRLQEALESAGVRVLVNEGTTLPYRNAILWLAGVDDPHSAHADIAKAAPDARCADLHLLLAHSPDILLHPLCARFDLVLCGHTHCGQIRLPGWGALWSHTRLGRWSGDCVLTPEQIARRLQRPAPQPYTIVSSGVATVGNPLFKARLFCPPEVGLIELYSSACEPAHTLAKKASRDQDISPAQRCE